MILVCKAGKKELDRITVEGESITYETQFARELVESRVESLGYTEAMKQLRSWSNGYVSISEIVTP